MNTSSIQSVVEDVQIKRPFGVPIHALTMDQTLKICRKAIEARQRLCIGVVNAAKIVRMRRDALLRDAVLGSDCVLADGTGVVWASRLLGQGIPERVAGIDLFERLLDMAQLHGYSTFFLGATQEVLDEVNRLVQSRYPNVRVAGSRNGYFPQGASEEVAAEIRAAHPDMLFVAMSSPKKELFLSQWAAKMAVPICHGVGGSFDVLAGKVKRAPNLLQRAGLEWFYRVIQEPRRLWKRYLITNTVFVAMILSEIFRRAFRRK